MSSGNVRDYIHSTEKEKLSKNIKKAILSNLSLILQQDSPKIHRSKKHNIHVFLLILFIPNTIIKFIMEFTASKREV